MRITTKPLNGTLSNYRIEFRISLLFISTGFIGIIINLHTTIRKYMNTLTIFINLQL